MSHDVNAMWQTRSSIVYCLRRTILGRLRFEAGSHLRPYKDFAPKPENLTLNFDKAANASSSPSLCLSKREKWRNLTHAAQDRCGAKRVQRVDGRPYRRRACEGTGLLRPRLRLQLYRLQPESGGFENINNNGSVHVRFLLFTYSRVAVTFRLWPKKIPEDPSSIL